MSDINWSQPAPLFNGEIPEFPSDVFPLWIDEFVKAVSEDAQTNYSLVATPVLSILSTALQNKFKVQVKEGWVEAINLYTIVSAKPSERKSVVFSKLTEPIRKHEAFENQERKPEVYKNRQDKKLLTDRIKELTKIVSKEKEGWEDEKEKLDKLVVDLSNFKDVDFINLLADDFTPESLASLMSKNGGQVSAMSAEGGIIGTISGRYSNGIVNLDIFLKSYTCESIRVDRQTRESFVIPNPALTFGLALQPCVLEDFIKNEELRERGFVARFLMCIHKSRIGNRKYNTKPIPCRIAKDYELNIQKMLKIQYPEKPMMLFLSNDAKIISENFNKELEVKLNEELGFIVDWAGKLHGQIVRIAGLLHIAENVNSFTVEKDNPFSITVVNDEISGDTFRKAIRIGEFFLENVKSILGDAGVNGELDDVKYLLNKLVEKEIVTHSKRELHQMVKGKLSKDTFDKALEVLADNGYVIIQDMNSSGKGRPSTQITVNPLWDRKI